MTNLLTETTSHKRKPAMVKVGKLKNPAIFAKEKKGKWLVMGFTRELQTIPLDYGKVVHYWVRTLEYLYNAEGFDKKIYGGAQ